MDPPLIDDIAGALLRLSFQSAGAKKLPDF